jgi:hypothetical protein
MCKKILFSLLLPAAITSHAFDGTPQLATRQAGAEHTLKLSHWKVDAKGVPSFDYTYEQSAGACRFTVSGHAVAGFEERNGKAVLDVFNPEDGKGKAMGQILMFYDDAVTLTLPLNGALRQVSFDDTLTDAQLPKTCLKQKDAQLSVLFQQ